MVVISRPSTRAASDRHDFTRLPSISTVQAPHWPRPHPFFEPVRRLRRQNVSPGCLANAQVDDPDRWIAARNQVAFLNLAAEALDDDCLGLTLATEFDCRDLG